MFWPYFDFISQDSVLILFPSLVGLRTLSIIRRPAFELAGSSSSATSLSACMLPREARQPPPRAVVTSTRPARNLACPNLASAPRRIVPQSITRVCRTSLPGAPLVKILFGLGQGGCSPSDPGRDQAPSRVHARRQAHRRIRIRNQNKRRHIQHPAY